MRRILIGVGPFSLRDVMAIAIVGFTIGKKTDIEFCYRMPKRRLNQDDYIVDIGGYTDKKLFYVKKKFTNKDYNTIKSNGEFNIIENVDSAWDRFGKQIIKDVLPLLDEDMVNEVFDQMRKTVIDPIDTMKQIHRSQKYDITKISLGALIDLFNTDYPCNVSEKEGAELTHILKVYDSCVTICKGILKTHICICYNMMD